MNNTINNCNIFDTITEIDDEIIYLNNGDDDKNDDDKNPSTYSVSQLLENYIKSNNHLSFLTLLKIILSNESDENLMDNNNNIYLYFHKIFLPNHSRINAVSII